MANASPYALLLASTVAIALLSRAEGQIRACPEKNRNHVTSSMPGDKVSIIFSSEIPDFVDLYWVNPDRKEVHSGSIDPIGETRINTWPGHAFRFYQAETQKEVLLMEYVVNADDSRITISSCDGVREVAVNSDRADEFEALVHDQAAPCTPLGKSSQWSCIKYTDKDAYTLRPQHLYGFKNKSEAGRRKVGATLDTGYTSHIPYVIRVTDGPGFLKMSFTQKLKDMLISFTMQKKTDVIAHSQVPGGYMNDAVIRQDKIDLDNFRHIQRGVHRELKDVLEWWTGMRLRHTSTFGIRIYRRENMLINHVDRADTHLASVVIQVHQEVDEDGGWPLEILDDEGNAYEVFLQPGEMVLYEGAVFRHGRPMRFRGDEFANIFSHFAPLDWHGPHKSPNYDHLLPRDVKRDPKLEL